MPVSSIPQREMLNSVVFVGNYLPRRCGIATFTTDLLNAFHTESPETNCWAVAINDILKGYPYPRQVRFEVSQNKIAEYHLAANFLNMNAVDVVCLQHEFGIFGGKYGIHILEMLNDLRMPLVTTLHTVLENPGQGEKEILIKLGRISDRLIVMSYRAVDMLYDIYHIPRKKIVHIHHGIPDVAFVDPSFYKDQFGVEGRKVILTFGLLSPSKGIEYMIDALPEIVKKHPEVVYIILGATHPNIKKEEGENYRISLQQRARYMGVENNIIFHNRFVEFQELCEFLGGADIYVTSYLNQNQIVSGTLAYALGTGKATISTPYWYAEEMLDEGRGRLVPFCDSSALAEEVIDLLDNETKRHAMRKRAYTFCRQMVWKEVARSYLEVFLQVKKKSQKKPRYIFQAKTLETAPHQLPEIRLDHLRVLTDDTGILQHAKFTVPNRLHGYSTDDNARALIVVMMAQDMVPENDKLNELAFRYLSFLDYAFNISCGRFRNFMAYDRKWIEDKGSEDSHGRAIWGLGEVVNSSESENMVAMALNLFKRAIPAMESFTSPRAWAFGIVGIHSYMRRFGGDSEARRMRKLLSEKLFHLYESNSSDDWPWIENSLNYSNGKIPHALLLSGQWLKRKEMINTGLRILNWLMEIQTDPLGHYVPIGNHGWYSKNGYKARFDQQPVEAHAMIDACIEAHSLTGDDKWIGKARLCFDWFLGKNDLQVSLYDFTTKGCRDGLQSNGANQNQGAESTLAWLLSLLRMNTHHISRALAAPGKPTPSWISGNSIEEKNKSDKEK